MENPYIISGGNVLAGVVASCGLPGGGSRLSLAHRKLGEESEKVLAVSLETVHATLYNSEKPFAYAQFGQKGLDNDALASITKGDIENFCRNYRLPGMDRKGVGGILSA